MAWGWLPGRPLTDFGRRRPNLPLPLERVKSAAPLGRCRPYAGAGAWTETGRPLTPGSSPGQAPPLSNQVGGARAARAFEDEGRWAMVSLRGDLCKTLA